VRNLFEDTCPTGCIARYVVMATSIYPIYDPVLM
jgi:hypothetical protein